MREKRIKWNCSNCGAIYESEYPECPLCGSIKEQTQMKSEISEIESTLSPRTNQKYVSRYKKGRPVLKRKDKF